mmetsp:Transcript_47716/g.127757  ORF Transcript_47716/g.127757 Transcript_47716/m.127757 type:complete len:113 (-) Transcript_47716:197-535(-)
MVKGAVPSIGRFADVFRDWMREVFSQAGTEGHGPFFASLASCCHCTTRFSRLPRCQNSACSSSSSSSSSSRRASRRASTFDSSDQVTELAECMRAQLKGTTRLHCFGDSKKS